MFLIWKHNTQSKVKFNTISNENEITNNSEINEQISFFYKSIFQEKLPFPRNDLQAYGNCISPCFAQRTTRLLGRQNQ